MQDIIIPTAIENWTEWWMNMVRRWLTITSLKIPRYDSRSDSVSILFQIHSIFIKNISFIGSCYRFVVFLIVPIHFRKHLCTRDKNFVNEFIRLVITTSVTSVNSVTIEMPEVRTKTIVPRCMTSVLFFPKKKKIYVAYDILKIYS